MSLQLANGGPVVSKTVSASLRRRIVASKSQERADVIIGKNGLSKGVINEIKRRLKEDSIVKVKVLKTGLKVSGLNRREIAARVAELTESVLLEVRGRTFILYKPQPGGNKSKV